MFEYNTLKMVCTMSKGVSGSKDNVVFRNL